MTAILSKLHRAVYLYLPAILFLPVVGFSIWFGAARMGIAVAAWFAGGVSLWTLIEYLLHRFAFHYKARSAFVKKLVLFAHGYHHEAPETTRRAVLTMTMPSAVFLFGLIFLVLPPAAGWPLFGGIMTGYLAYDATHYIVHHWKMRGRVGRFLKTYHFKHHHKDNGRGFGVTSPFWDYVFGTRFTD